MNVLLKGLMLTFTLESIVQYNRILLMILWMCTCGEHLHPTNKLTLSRY